MTKGSVIRRGPSAARGSLGAVALLVLVAASPARGQQADAVDGLARDAAVRAALAAVKASEGQTIADQIRFCEVPAPPFKEAARADVLRREFLALGLQNVRIDKAGNVLGDRAGAAPHPRLVVAAHLDTVFAEGTPVAVKRADPILRGPGIGDNCRGLAVLVAVIRAFGQAQIRTPGSITFVANVGEEGLGDLRGMRALFGETMRVQVDRFVSIDGGGLHVTRIAVGSHRYRVTFRGPGGHSFADFGLANPVGAMGRAVARISAIQVPREPRTTFTVGRVGGGTSVNSIPADSWMEVDLRSSDPAALASLDAKFRQAVEAGVVEENERWGRPGTVSAAVELVGDRPAGAIAAGAPIVLTAFAAARALNLPVANAEGSTDANWPLSLGIPAIALGGGGRDIDPHAPVEAFDTTDAWKGSQLAVLVTAALAR